jgi:hypothetical protein
MLNDRVYSDTTCREFAKSMYVGAKSLICGDARSGKTGFSATTKISTRFEGFECDLSGSRASHGQIESNRYSLNPQNGHISAENVRSVEE